MLFTIHRPQPCFRFLGVGAVLQCELGLQQNTRFIGNTLQPLLETLLILGNQRDRMGSALSRIRIVGSPQGVIGAVSGYIMGRVPRKTSTRWGFGGRDMIRCNVSR